MALRIGSIAPDFVAQAHDQNISFHRWLDSKWCVLFSHPKDFTPVCTTEIGEAARLQSSFAARSCQLIGLSVDTVEDHRAWITDIRIATGQQVNFPLLSDPKLEVSKLYGMLPSEAGDSSSGRSAIDNQTVRSVFFIDPNRTIRAILTYPMTTGRSFTEILRVLDSLQLTDVQSIATPVNWSVGDDVIIPPSVSDVDAKMRYPQGWNAPLPYLRLLQSSTTSAGK